jgi:hypothetical protein
MREPTADKRDRPDALAVFDDPITFVLPVEQPTKF